MAGKGNPKTGGGSRKGIPNKDTGDIRALVIGALNKVGGLDYLAARALDNPVAFMGLIGRVLPTTVQGSLDLHSFVIRAPLEIESADQWLRLHAPSDSRTIEHEQNVLPKDLND